MKSFGWQLLHNSVFQVLTQPGIRLCVREAVMKIIVMANGAPKSPFDLDGLKRAIQQAEIAPSGLPRNKGQDKLCEPGHLPQLQSALATIPGGAEASGLAAAEVVHCRPALRSIRRLRRAPPPLEDI
jgi:hypothetical protein